jgi:hypothetical protein
MNGKSTTRNRSLGWLIAATLFYVVPYFLCSEIYRGQWQGTPMKLRLFHHEFETVLWLPLLKLEQLVTPGEFDGHIRSGASLPPPDPAYTEAE